MENTYRIMTDYCLAGVKPDDVSSEIMALLGFIWESEAW